MHDAMERAALLIWLKYLANHIEPQSYQRRLASTPAP
jgi:hypothetical protein